VQQGKNIMPATATVTTTATPAVAVVPTETALQHIESILGIFGTILEALLPIAAAVAAPFIKNPKSVGIVTTELPIVEGVAGTIAQL
jgi:hypothetical protein